MASLESVRDVMDVASTPENVGLTLTVRLTAYDNGLMNVNGRVLRGSHQSEAQGYTNAAVIIAMMIADFQRQVEHRREQGAASAA
jgi:hypothetical protein